jgi:hypothetical protein
VVLRGPLVPPPTDKKEGGDGDVENGENGEHFFHNFRRKMERESGNFGAEFLSFS